MAENEEFVKYLSPLKEEELWGFGVTTAGHTLYLPGMSYPKPRHPSSHSFSLNRGRVLNEYQIVYIVIGTKNPYEIEKWMNLLKNGLPYTSNGDISSIIKPLKDYTPESVKASKYSGDLATSIIATELANLSKINQQIYDDFLEKIKDIARDINLLK